MQPVIVSQYIPDVHRNVLVPASGSAIMIMQCDKCGAAVSGLASHNDWHDAIEARLTLLECPPTHPPTPQTLIDRLFQ